MSTAHGWMRTRLAEAQVALMLLTRLPAGDVGEGAPGLGAAAWAFPLAGLAVGGIVGWLFVGALHWGLRPTVAAGVAIVAGLIVTGGLHEDGLADVADGFGGGQSRPAKLEIMKDSRLGSYGALALIAALGLRWAMLAQVGQVQVIIALAVASRAAMVPALAAMPAARADGLGRAAVHAPSGRSGRRRGEGRGMPLPGLVAGGCWWLWAWVLWRWRWLCRRCWRWRWRRPWSLR